MISRFRTIALSLLTTTLVTTATHAQSAIGTWDILDHKLEDGGTYHIYIHLDPTATSGDAGYISYPWGHRPVRTAVWNGDHFQLMDTEHHLLAEGDRSGNVLKMHLAVGRQKDQPRIAMSIPAEPIPTKLPYPSLHSVSSNGLASTPPMGWNSWNKFEESIDDKTARATADAMVANGMRDAGYIYVNIDDTWQGPRDAQGNITSNRKFPDMKGLSDYIHSKGLKLGIYSSPGPLTCAGYLGSYGHEEQDAKVFAAWGVDYLKYDWCSAGKIYQPSEMQAVYQKMGDALAHSGRPIIFGLCQYGEADVWKWGPAVGANLWRTTNDISDSWTRMEEIGFAQDRVGSYARPGHWNDPDMLEVGNGGMTPEEYRTHFTLWSLLAAPLLAGNDVASMDAATRSILLNREVIAIDQDPAGKQATLLKRSGKQEIWIRRLSDGDVAIGLFNRALTRADVTVDLSAVGVTGSALARDIWNRKDMTLSSPAYTAQVPAHGVVLLRITRSSDARLARESKPAISNP